MRVSHLPPPEEGERGRDGERGMEGGREGGREREKRERERERVDCSSQGYVPPDPSEKG